MVRLDGETRFGLVGLHFYRPRLLRKESSRVERQLEGVPGLVAGLEPPLVVAESAALTDGAVFPMLNPGVYNHVRTVAPGYDPYVLAAEWQETCLDTGCPKLHDRSGPYCLLTAAGGEAAAAVARRCRGTGGSGGLEPGFYLHRRR